VTRIKICLNYEKGVTGTSDWRRSQINGVHW